MLKRMSKKKEDRLFAIFDSVEFDVRGMKDELALRHGPKVRRSSVDVTRMMCDIDKQRKDLMEASRILGGHQ